MILASYHHDQWHDPQVACIPNLQTYVAYKVVQFLGNETLAGVTLRKMAGDETLDLPAQGVFIDVGLEPNSSPAARHFLLNLGIVVCA
jgi:thioredoxin reductase